MLADSSILSAYYNNIKLNKFGIITAAFITEFSSENKTNRRPGGPNSLDSRGFKNSIQKFEFVVSRKLKINNFFSIRADL